MNRTGNKRRGLLVSFAALVGLVAAVTAPAAAAGAPIRSEISFSDTGVLADACAFPIAVSANGSGTETDFFDRNGALTRIEVHVTEQTAFSANGHTLTTLPFTYNIRVRLDESGITR